MPAKPRAIPQLRALQRKELLYKVAQEEIKSYIIAHALRPGDALPPETDLSQQLNISRNSVREAVKSLETLGVLEARPGAGLFVCDFSFEPLLNHLGYGMLFDLKHLSELLEVRGCIECGMVPRVVAAVTPAQVGRLRAVMDRMRDEAKLGRYSAGDDRLFHQLLYANVNNAVVGKLLDVFWVAFQQAQARADLPKPADPMDTYRRHMAILQPLEKKNVQAMQTAMARHYTGIQQRIEQAERSARKAKGDGGPAEG
jgi:DNA-binding FadR family transcriptional regulator